MPILTAARTSYAYDTKEDFVYAQDPWSAGTQMHLVSALQARNNARVTIAGSVDMFSNEFFDLKVKKVGSEKPQKAVNRVFAKNLSEWTFMEKGVVKVVGVRHYLKNETDAEINPGMYRIKNDVVSICYASWP
jgi:oligosaccharyltransferase complex subunit beta